jgi:protein disulfide-isomerase A6
MLDCTAHAGPCSKYDVSGYPTIKVFGEHKKEPELYEGGRVSSSIVTAALDLLQDMQMTPKPVSQLTGQHVIEEQCKDVSLCLVAFLPHVLDTGAEGRNAFLDILAAQAKKYKKQGYGMVWAEAFTQPELEQALDVGGGGYPAMNAVNLKKMLNIPFFGGFDAETVDAFVSRVVKGKERPMKMGDLPTLAAVEAWDGKDGEMPKEEL